MPTIQEVHVNKPLTNVAIQYSQEMIYIANQALPPLPVQKESDIYFKYTLKDAINSPVNPIRAPGAESKEDTFDITTATYSAEEYALKDIVADRIRKNQDKPINLDIDTTKFLTNKIMLAKEKRVADILFDTTGFAGYTQALDAANKWDSYTSADSNPIEDVKTANSSVEENVLRPANTVIIGKAVFDKVVRHPLILDIIKYGGTPANPATVTAKALAQVFDVEKVLIGRAVINSAAEGQTVTPTRIWGKFVLVAYINPKPPLKDVTLGFQPEAQTLQTLKWRETKRKGDMIEVGEIVDEVIVSYGAGYLFSTVVV